MSRTESRARYAEALVHRVDDAGDIHVVACRHRCGEVGSWLTAPAARQRPDDVRDLLAAVAAALPPCPERRAGMRSDPR